MKLTKTQKEVFQRIENFLWKDEENPAIVVAGSAGTGKTTLTAQMVTSILNRHKSVVAIAPTHKAKRVLSSVLNKTSFIPVACLTIASILGKMRDHSYIGSHRYSLGTKQKMDRYDFFIMDEVSMVSDKDLDEILDYICEHDKKIIIIGDNCQIPCPSQKIVVAGDYCFKPDSSAFDIENIIFMREIVRQVKDSPIIRIATYIRDNIDEENSLRDILDGSGTHEEEMCLSIDDIYESFVKDWRNTDSTRIIAYTNAAVRSHNTDIRLGLGHDEPVVVGELLTGYANVGFPVPVIENGTDYRVTSVREVNNYKILDFSGLSGFVVSLEDVNDITHVSKDLFFISARHSSNRMFMSEVVRRAEMVNRPMSTKNDYRRYCELKNSAVFIEDVYKFGHAVMTETNFRQLHPLLFTKVGELIDTTSKVAVASELSDKLHEQYGDVSEKRINDNKPFADGETFADQYMVVEKDIYYGYAITSHKSQGSTYRNVYVDEHDFKKISSKWNYYFQRIELRHREKNQLRYVAYTRASEKLRIFS